MPAGRCETELSSSFDAACAGNGDDAMLSDYAECLFDQGRGWRGMARRCGYCGVSFQASVAVACEEAIAAHSGWTRFAVR